MSKVDHSTMVTYFRVKEYEHIYRVVIHGGMDHLVGYVFEDETNNFDVTIHSSPQLAKEAFDEYCATYLNTGS
ncbi:MAG: hypothetical protein ACRDCE_11280 [Cetobacterium sp.]|uniref:hypothetical protein n=1 Tax=Cetobacterium sp. TaxID=2071632 RepID=UPI003EE6370C